MSSNAITIIYGTQTGNAADAAAELQEALGGRCRCGSAQFYDVSELPREQRVVFVVSTYGDGEAPDAFVPLWRQLLRRQLPADWLRGVEYTVFGLGDSAYPKFNAVAQRLDVRLQRLGARRYHAVGLGDGAAWEEHWQQWLRSLLGAAALQRWQEERQRVPPSPRSGLRRVLSGACFVGRRELCFQSAAESADQQEKRVMQVTLRVVCTPSAEAPFVPGDVAYVLPHNRGGLVDAFFTLFPHLDPDALHVWEDAAYVRQTCREVVQRSFDLNALPRRRFLRQLATFATEPREQARLRELAADAAQYEAYITREQRSVLLVLRDFVSARPPSLPHLLSLMPRLQPRGYSIASDMRRCMGKADDHGQRQVDIDLCVRAVRYVTRLRRQRIGVASGYFDELTPGDAVAMWVQPGVLRVPPDDRVPVLMVATGTGIGVFRCMATQWAVSARRSSANSEQCNKVLVHGCRRVGVDDLYADAWPEEHVLRLVAESRPADSGAPKMYVQHRLRQDAQLVYERCFAGADRRSRVQVLVAGGSAGASMPAEVRRALLEAVLGGCGGMRADEADACLRQMVREGRYRVEVWD
ncbi:hypothetical protein CDCA_CDCA02G0807 [Cyanidium caldarium]|uniref:NADPH-dependent diflavin oxidoreductase 1 n=1 Tax=Cyanidium caldarium TaxID=2771 RepID=A0AAV9IR57_CYACA|nr:hypothetical protein CDCA_CDCA02G0807 [Cyanidium caldarium]|eukprot:ctg_639.g271